MPDYTPPHSHETRDELAASSQLASVERRLRRTEWMSRTTAALCIALIVAVGTTSARADTFAAVPEDTPADPALVRDLEAELAVLAEKVRADLDVRIQRKTDAIVQQAAEQQIAALLQRTEQNLAMFREISKRIDERIEERAVKVASGSLALSLQTLRDGENERVERGRLRFEERFVRAPKVTLGMRLIDPPRSDRPRVAIRVVEVDEKGFDYEIRTWGSSSVVDLTADWVAYAPGSPTAPPASAR